MQLVAKNISKNYILNHVSNRVLHDVTFAIEPGEFVAITGSSGSGKSTLMNLLGCLDKPTEGSYFIENEEISLLGDDDLARVRNTKLGFVFQRFNLLPTLTALDNVMLPRLFRGDSEEQARVDALKLLERVQLTRFTEHYPYQLSGGQQQRVAIARALINGPRILFADEPTGNLDSVSGALVMEYLYELNKNDHMTILMVTHDGALAAKAPRLLKLVDGILVIDTKKNKQ